MTKIPKDEYPRVLVVNGEPFSEQSATGLTVTSLFKNWPKERLACIYISQMEPDRTVCDRYWKLSFADLRCVRYVLGSVRAKVTAKGNADRHGVASTASTTNQRRSAIRHFLTRLRLRLAGQSVRDLDVYRISPRLMREIEAFRPQVVYSLLACNPLLRLVTDLSDHFSIPIVPHFMDDWPTTKYRPSAFRFLLRRIMHRRLREVLERSPERMVIGDAMAEEYAQRYGGNFLPFMNAVEPEALQQPIVRPKQRETIRLIYIGGLHLNRWRSLYEIGMALKQLQGDGHKVEAMVYSQPSFRTEAKKLNIPPVMRFAGSLAPSEIPEVLCDADILLHVESFDRACRIYTRYSVSTKIPECMAAARPILAYGPEELASIHYVRDSGAGLAVGHRERNELAASLHKLIVSRELRNHLGTQGQRVASARHNAAFQREQFRSVLQRATRIKNK